MFNSMGQSNPQDLGNGGTLDGDVTITGDLTVSGGIGLTLSEVIEGTSTIDVTNTEAFLIRKNGDGGDLLTIDTTNSRMLFSGELRLYDKDGDGTFGGRIRYDNSDNELRIESNEVSGDDIAIKGNDAILFQDSGGTKMILDGGNLGIGTGANVDELLHVQNDSNNAVIKIEAGSSSTGARLQMISATNDTGDINFGDSGDTNIGRIKYDHTDNYLAIHTNDSEKFRIDSSGNVGINTATPSSYNIGSRTLVVSSGSGSVGGITIANPTDGSGYLTWCDTANTTNQAWIGYLHDGNSLVFASDSSERMRLDSSGRLGIGTTAPGDYNAVADDLVVYNSGNSGMTIASGGTYGAIYFADGTSGTAEYMGGLEYNHSNNSMKLWSNGAANHFIIDSSGKIGIGSDAATPLGKFHIASADSGSTAHADADELVVEGSTSAGISIISDHDATAKIIFGCAEDTQAARITNTQSTGVFTIGACQTNGVTKIEAGSGTIRMVIDDDSRISTSNLDSGTGNTIFGKGAGFPTGTNSNNNVIIGQETFDLVANDGAVGNVFVGYRVARGNPTADTDHNVGVGYVALNALTSGDSNICLGSSAGVAITEAHNIIAIGRNAVATASSSTNTDGTIAIGRDALTALTTGAGNVAIGYQSLQDITQGDDNIAIGKQSLFSMATTDGNDNNIAIGTTALYTAGASSNVATGNVAIGTNSLKLNQTGDNNVCIGTSSGDALTAANECVAVGSSALGAVATQDGTVAIGRQALAALTSGAGNVGIGYQCLDAITNSANNTAVGYQAMTAANHVDAVDNTCIGYKAGDVIQGGGDNTCIGALTDPSAHGGVNQTVIGKGTTGQADNSVTLGNGSVTKVYMSSDGDAEMYANGTINTSDKRLKENINDADLGLSFVNALRPVSYKFIDDKKPEKLKYGIIAQEVQEVLKESGNEDFAGITDKGDYLGADYVQFIAPLIKAVQELSAKVEALEKK